jgi:hypothetical protein
MTTTTTNSTMTPEQDAAMQRAADAAVDMLSGMVAARVDLGMTDDEIKVSILDSLHRMAAK